MKVLLVSHRADMDGVTSALFARVYARQEYPDADIVCAFADYEDADQILIENAADADAVIITDLSWRHDPHNLISHVNRNHFYCFDHHASSEGVFHDWFLEDYPNVILDITGTRCASDIVFSLIQDPKKNESYYAMLRESTSAVDLWKVESEPEAFARGRILSAVLSQLGPEKMMEELTCQPSLIDPSTWNYDSLAIGDGCLFHTVFRIAERANAKSLASAENTLCIHHLNDHSRIFAAFCTVNSSEIASKLQGSQLGYVALVNPSNGSISLRTTLPTIEKNGFGANDIAKQFGGGGHPCSAGCKAPGTVLTDGSYGLAKAVYAAIQKILAEKEGKV